MIAPEKFRTLKPRMKQICKSQILTNMLYNPLKLLFTKVAWPPLVITLQIAHNHIFNVKKLMIHLWTSQKKISRRAGHHGVDHVFDKLKNMHVYNQDNSNEVQITYNRSNRTITLTWRGCQATAAAPPHSLPFSSAL